MIAENVPCGSTGVTCTKNIFIHYKDMTINLMRGRDIQVGDNEIRDLEKGSRVFGDVTLMSAGLFQIISSPNFIIKWDGGKLCARMTTFYFLNFFAN